MQLIARKPLYRINVGERFEASESMGRLALALGLAVLDVLADLERPIHVDPIPRRRYRRRDLQAED